MTRLDAPVLEPAADVIADWCELPLHPGGRCLIEASAGTGKTWTISVLYLRLLLEGEAPLSPRQIAVATFTDAAAQELCERLRQRIAWAVHRACVALEQGRLDADSARSDEAWLAARWVANDALDTARVRADLNRLRLAQFELDLAPIGTLHAFCRRILSDYPFECGSAFGLGELASVRALNAELLQDLWRELVQSDGALDEGSRAWLAAGRKVLEDAMERVLAPGVVIRELDPEALAEVMRAEHADWLDAFVEDATPFARSNAAIRTVLRALVQIIRSGDPGAALPGNWRSCLVDDVHKQFRPAYLDDDATQQVLGFARHAFHTLTHALAPARAAALRRFREQILQRRERRLREHGLLTFDAQISRVHEALHGDAGAAFAARLHEAWPVMLVDEFQDTDGQQFAILDRIYRDAGGGARGRLVMIGDPKQAIYRFRGGDIHAYVRAKASADTILQLQTNHRSSTAFVGALNDWFRLAGGRLSQHDALPISVEAVRAAGHADADALHIDGAPCTRPLAFHLQPDCPGTRDDRCRAALGACANHIASLLESRGCTLGGRPLRPGDIAVLLPRNDDVAKLRTLLLERGVPCVGASRQGVFATSLARDLHVFLHGIEHAGSDPAVRAALATRLGGATFDDLHSLHGDAARWQAVAQKFARWRARWHAGGVLAVVREVIAESGPRLVRHGDGERTLTDLRHLAELLQEAGEQLDGPQALLAWLAAQRDATGEAGDEEHLRIESDARRVRVMTLHASKGLEFPVVFLPLMWMHSGREPDWPLVHDAALGARVLDLGSARFDDAVRDECIEDQDERFRVLYVAMTRAQHACHVYALPHDRPDGRSKKPSVDPERSALDAMLDRLRLALVDGRSMEVASDRIAWSEGWPWQSAHYRPEAEPRAPRPRVLREPPAPRPQGKHSFSTLTRSARIAIVEEAAAIDEDIAEPVVRDAGDAPRPLDDEAFHPQLQALAAVRGADFGNALHDVFEHRRIGIPVAEQHDLVRQSLLEAGVRSRELPVDTLVPLLAGRIDATLQAELLPGLRLAGIPARSLRAEMEFHFALDDVAIRELRSACAGCNEPELVPMLSGPRLHGLMTGKIDLVFEHAGRFHVLDYKGNFLGERVGDYAPAALRDAMDAHCYRFQALLYTVAVDRYLRQRLPRYRRSEQLGEAIYVFVRATGLAPGAGVWTQRFDDALIEAVDRALGGRGA